MTNQHTTTLAAVAAAAVLAVGAWAIGKSSGSDAVATSAPAGAPTMQQQAAPPGGSNGAATGQAPPGLGTAVTGATADKVERAALAAHPGTIERIMQLPDGSYVAHVITSSGELHVTVSKAFKVTGTEQGGPGGSGMPPGGTTSQ